MHFACAQMISRQLVNLSLSSSMGARQHTTEENNKLSKNNRIRQTYQSAAEIRQRTNVFFCTQITTTQRMMLIVLAATRRQRIVKRQQINKTSTLCLVWVCFTRARRPRLLLVMFHEGYSIGKVFFFITFYYFCSLFICCYYFIVTINVCVATCQLASLPQLQLTRASECTAQVVYVKKEIPSTNGSGIAATDTNTQA